MKDIIDENRRRNQALSTPYNPLTGEGCQGERVHCGELWLPTAMVRDHPDWHTLPMLEQNRLRVRYDFEFWAASCATIKDKRSARNIKFVLNAPQRRLLAAMEQQRTAGKPVRVILLKARQWGGSTLVQMYMAWIQIVIHKQWNSLICGHLRQASHAIKRMYNTLLSNYPSEYIDDGVKLQFRNFEGSSTVQQLCGRDCLLVLGSSRSEDAVRGYDLAMAHLTEVAFWASTPMHSPEDVVRSVSGTVSLMPDTVVVYESTANGVGNFFHNEWIRAKADGGDKVAIFVPWYEIELYRMPVSDAAALWQVLDDYERDLWNKGCTLEMLQWYHTKRREYSSHALMMAEFPSNDIEAFSGTGKCIFDLDVLDSFSVHTCLPRLKGDITGEYKRNSEAIFTPSPVGLLSMWRDRDITASPGRYLVVVDVGGRSDKADFSVIMVMDTHRDCPDVKPEVVAQWRGHIDHDLLAWKALHVARYYCNARLVIESNTLETEYDDCDAGEFVLNKLACQYGFMYRRKNGKPGFQTNRKTKHQAIYELIKAVREHSYIERDQQAINEMATYECNSRGQYGAMQGHHDDVLMTRAIALAVIYEDTQRHLHSITAADKASLQGTTASQPVLF